ncbi:hypothetical protein [Bacillus pinisoli]|uniref:hypothetical protein n=1 Tax=Bacillus pinisoli TaxID=2901866 RepID=UPI001FF5D1B5|nr:hypothetical protein [Bacillus pinisoli]
MVTISMVIFFGLSVFLLSSIDSIYYQEPLQEAFLYIIFPESATRESIAMCALIAGFIYAGIVDYRHHKYKQSSSKQAEGKQP